MQRYEVRILIATYFGETDLAQPDPLTRPMGAAMENL